MGFFSTNTPNPPWRTLNKYFSLFHGISVNLGSFRNCLNVGAKWGELGNYCKSSCHEVTLGFFATKTTNPPDCTLYQCFSAFRSIWVHLGSFRNCMKLVAKHTEL